MISCFILAKPVGVMLTKGTKSGKVGFYNMNIDFPFSTFANNRQFPINVNRVHWGEA